LALAGSASAAVYDFSFAAPNGDSATGNFTVVGATVVSGIANFYTAALGDFTASLLPGSSFNDGSFNYDNLFPVDYRGLLFENVGLNDEVNIFPNPGLIATVGTTPNVNLYVANPIGTENYQVADVGTLTITSVPEAATWAMMLVGLGGMGAVLRSSRRKAAVAA
jgi:hypothetical protein